MISRGEDFIFAQDFEAVARFVGLDFAPERLPPGQLVEKLELMLGAGLRYMAQIPTAEIGEKLPGRDRSYLELCYHVVQVAAAFLSAVEGARLSQELVAGPMPEGIAGAADVAEFGEKTRAGLAQWWAGAEDRELTFELDTYYGPQSAHALLERTSWHAAQHCRQLMMVLEQLGLSPEKPLTAGDLAGLPVPEKVWDDETGP